MCASGAYYLGCAADEILVRLYYYYYSSFRIRLTPFETSLYFMRASVSVSSCYYVFSSSSSSFFFSIHPSTFIFLLLYAQVDPSSVVGSIGVVRADFGFNKAMEKVTIPLLSRGTLVFYPTLLVNFDSEDS